MISHQFLWCVKSLAVSGPCVVNLHHDVLTVIDGTRLTIKKETN